MNLQNFMRRFNPDAQTVLCKNPENCWFGNYPTLEQVNRIYGDNASEDWLTAQINNLQDFYSDKKKLSVLQLDELPALIYSSYPYLRITEMMLFFYYFKRGDYESFFDVIDPIKITKSLKIFVTETRSNAYAAKEEEIEREYRNACKSSSMTEEEYLRSKGLPCQESKLDDMLSFESVPSKNISDIANIAVFESAMALVNNIYGYTDDVHQKMCEGWKARYKCTPQEYVDNFKRKEE